MEYKTMDELAGLHRELSPDEVKQLEANIVSDGRVIDPIIVWDTYLLDGRHRLKIAEKHDLPYDVQEMEFESIDDAQLWVLEHQLGRRNITDHEKMRLRAQHARIVGDTRVVAEEHNVSQRTIQRDVEATEVSEKMPQDLATRLNEGTLIASKAALKRYDELTDEQKKKVEETLRDHPDITLQQAIPRKDFNLTPEDFEILNNSKVLSGPTKQRISLGTIVADHKSVQAFAKLSPANQELVGILLEDDQVDGMAEAVATVKGSVPQQAASNGEKLRMKVEDGLEKLMRLVDDFYAVSDNEGHSEVICAIRQALTEWRKHSAHSK